MVTISWIKKLISSGNTAPFYNTPEWKRLREEIFKDTHYECERCAARGLVSTNSKMLPKDKRIRLVAHHKKYLRQYPELALAKSNLECLCDKCHYEEHHPNEQLNEERW